MAKYKGAKCFVVVLMRGGFKLYLKDVKDISGEGAPLPIFEGAFIPDLIEAKKFLNAADAEFFAHRFDGAQVEIIKNGGC